MTQFFKLDPARGKSKIRELAHQLQSEHPDATASVREGLDEIFTITELGVTGELALCLVITNVSSTQILGALSQP